MDTIKKDINIDDVGEALKKVADCFGQTYGKVEHPPYMYTSFWAGVKLTKEQERQYFFALIENLSQESDAPPEYEITPGLTGEVIARFMFDSVLKVCVTVNLHSLDMTSEITKEVRFPSTRYVVKCTEYALPNGRTITASEVIHTENENQPITEERE